MKIKREKRQKTILLLTGFAFFASGADYLENELITLAILSIFVGVLNFLALPFIKKYNFSLSFSLMIINGIYAAITSIILFLSGKEYIQYGWLVVSIINIVASIIFYRKHKMQKL